MPAQSPFRSPLSMAALAILAFSAIAISSRASKRVRSPDPPPPACEGLSPEECRALLDSLSLDGEGEGAVPLPVGAILPAGEACRDVGYLCAEVDSTGNLQLLRWPRDTDRIRVWVPEPEGLPAVQAREFQRAAVRGIRSWHGHPIPLSIRTRSTDEEPDVTVQWSQTVQDGRLGQAQMEWRKSGAEVDVQIVGFFIATQVPGMPQRALDPTQVELIAAHEMGHALGLPHSDDSRDVMFPQNTATRLTARDFKTVEALYRLPNGAEIRR